MVRPPQGHLFTRSPLTRSGLLTWQIWQILLCVVVVSQFPSMCDHSPIERVLTSKYLIRQGSRCPDVRLGVVEKRKESCVGWNDLRRRKIKVHTKSNILEHFGETVFFKNISTTQFPQNLRWLWGCGMSLSVIHAAGNLQSKIKMLHFK